MRLIMLLVWKYIKHFYNIYIKLEFLNFETYKAQETINITIVYYCTRVQYYNNIVVHFTTIFTYSVVCVNSYF